jgi:hypothetical protein
MANPQRRANRDRMFKSLLAAGYDGGTAGSIANTANWDQANRRFNAAMANAPGKQQTQSAPKPPKMPKTPKPPEQTMTTISQAGEGVKRPGGKRKKTTLASLRIKPRKINQQVGGLGSGGSLNIGGY